MHWKIFLIIVSVMMLFSSRDVNSQWLGDTRLTNNSAESSTNLNNGRCIAAVGNYVHIVWTDLRDGNAEIYYKRSTDAGVSWGSDTRLTNEPQLSNSPSIIASGSVLHLYWNDSRNGYEIYYKRSTDNGTTWGADIRLTYTAESSRNPMAVISGQVIHLVWDEEIDLGNEEIFYKRSTNEGLSWDSAVRLTNWPLNSRVPSVSSSGLNVYVAWEDSRDVWPNIYYKRSTDGGITWSADLRMSAPDQNNSIQPMISSSGNNVHLVWSDYRDTFTTYQILYKYSSNSGASWSQDTNITMYYSYKYNSSISISGNLIHLIWTDIRDGNHEIYYKNSTNGGTSWGPDTR